MDITAERVYMDIERITGSPTVPNHWPRCLLNGVPMDQETITEQHTELYAKRPSPRPIKWLPRSQQIFAEAAYWDCDREVNQERTEAIIRMTSTAKRFTETLPNAESRDAEICICNVQSGIPRAEARSYHGEYDHLLQSEDVRYG